MSGLILIPILVIWLVTATILSSKIPDWLGIKKHATAWTLVLFPLVLTAPIADELIGRVQFHYLCKKEAVVTLSPDWQRVKWAAHRELPMITLKGYVIPIQLQREEYFDKATDKTFISKRAFHTKGGFLMRHGLGLDGITSCWPPQHESIYREINLEFLLKGY